MMTSFSPFRLLLLVTALAGITTRSMATTAMMRGSATTPTTESSSITSTTIEDATIEAPPTQHDTTTTTVQASSRPDSRRRLIRESSCTLFRKCVTYAPSDEHPHGHHVDSWVCELSEDDRERMDGIQFVDIIETQPIRDTISNATSGGSLMTVSHAIIDTAEPRMTIPEDAHVVVHDHVTGTDTVHPTNTAIDRDLFGTSMEGDRGNNRRKLAKTTGTLNTLVIRVIDKNGVQPTANTATMINNVFTDASSLKTQTEACSHNKLKIEPFRGNTPNNRYINNGVVDVTMDYDINSDDLGMDQAALKAARETIGELDDPMFDLLLICFPPGKPDFLAFAYPNSKYSFYNNEWCGYVAAQMHEVGHNIGLAHSGELGEGEYGDSSGYMGGSPGQDDYKQCYNPQKNYQLGWYEDQTTTINPLDGKDKREFILNGVVDYGNNDDALVVLRLKQSTRDQDYYIGYNRATDINIQTGENRDHVTVVRKEYGAPDQYGQSTKIAGLSPGQRTFIDDFNGSGKKVQVAFTGIDENGNARIMILEGTNPPPSPPVPCQRFTVVVDTDDYPDDNSWYFKDTGGWGRVGALSIVFQEKNTEYRQEVCLPRGRTDKTYKFSIEDKYGDGMGGYRVFNSNNVQIISGGKNFRQDKKWIHHYVEVDGDSTIQETPPPTAYPTMAPTATPPCREYLVEVKTDRYPADTKWLFARSNHLGDDIVDEESSPYSELSRVTTTEVCLQIGTTYDFRFSDAYGDGLCCGGSDAEKGYYKVMDKCSGEVVQDSGINDVDFKVETYTIQVPNNEGCGVETSPPTTPPTKKATKCKNKTKRKFKVTKGKGSRKKSCKAYAKAKQCDVVIKGGKYGGKTVGNICKQNCKLC